MTASLGYTKLRGGMGAYPKARRREDVAPLSWEQRHGPRFVRSAGGIKSRQRLRAAPACICRRAMLLKAMSSPNTPRMLGLALVVAIAVAIVAIAMAIFALGPVILTMTSAA